MKPNKILGQHFLKSSRPILHMIQAAKKEPTADVALEIGPGKGILTRALCRAFKKVVAVEKDPRLAEDLRRSLKNEGVNNYDITTGDILKTDWQRIVRKDKYAVVANIPYYLTSRLIRVFLESNRQPVYMILMVQKEVGGRIIAKPPDMNLLALSVQAYGKSKIIAEVSKKEFTPEPKVDSVIIKISGISHEFFKKHNISDADFFAMLRAAFRQKRKQIGNALAVFLGDKINSKKQILQMKMSPKSRPQELSLNEWKTLFLSSRAQQKIL